MAEWLKAHAWKACIGETLSWVRIPFSPPNMDQKCTFSDKIQKEEKKTKKHQKRLDYQSFCTILCVPYFIKNFKSGINTLSKKKIYGKK